MHPVSCGYHVLLLARAFVKPVSLIPHVYVLFLMFRFHLTCIYHVHIHRRSVNKTRAMHAVRLRMHIANTTRVQTKSKCKMVQNKGLFLRCRLPTVCFVIKHAL